MPWRTEVSGAHTGPDLKHIRISSISRLSLGVSLQDGPKFDSKMTRPVAT